MTIEVSRCRLAVATVLAVVVVVVAASWYIIELVGHDSGTPPNTAGGDDMVTDAQRHEATAFYRVRSKAPWGDYGAILVKGLLIERSDRDGRLTIHRAGPFAPPIMLPCDEVIVTGATRRKMESAFPGLSYREVIKQKVVELHWEEWNRDAHDVPLYPEEGEPDDYFIGPHSPEASAAMGDLWEVVLPRGGSSHVKKDATGQKANFVFDVPTWTGADLFATFPTSTHITVVSARGKQWLEREAGEWLRFELLETRH